MSDLPTTIAEIDRFISDATPEGLHLDYKASAAIDNSKRHEITKDVSAFANSDGGLLIYGVEEKDNIPIGKDDGVEHFKYKREWIEQVIQDNISPRIDGLQIAQIHLSLDRSIYAIKIPKSYRGPHQAMDKKYYKRFNFQSVAMEDYEINDIRSRKQVLPPLISFDIEIEGGMAIFIIVTNIGTLPAIDVIFEFSENLIWYSADGTPAIFARGAKYFPPGRSYRFFYHGFSEVVSEDTNIPAKFDATVSYIHPQIGQRVSDTFHIDVRDYWNSSPAESEIYEHAKTLKDAIGKLTEEIKNLNKNVSQMATIGGPTGLDLSITTLKNLKHLMTGEDQIERINPMGCSYTVFMEVLGVDYKTAHQLRVFFRTPDQTKKLTEVEGITGDLVEKIRKYFIVAEDAT